MARITGLPSTRASWLQRVAYWMSKRMLGKVPDPMTVAAHNAPIFNAYVGYEYFLGKANRVEARLKALAGVKAAALVGCPF